MTFKTENDILMVDEQFLLDEHKNIHWAKYRFSSSRAFSIKILAIENEFLFNFLLFGAPLDVKGFELQVSRDQMPVLQQHVRYIW